VFDAGSCQHPRPLRQGPFESERAFVESNSSAIFSAGKSVKSASSRIQHRSREWHSPCTAIA
jgi:hypothetical protein